MAPVRGGVRIEFTDRRIQVVWTGRHQLFLGAEEYRRWKEALPTESSFRTPNRAWSQGPGEVAWDFEKSKITGVVASRGRGPWADRSMCQLRIIAWLDGIRVGAMGPLSESNVYNRVVPNVLAVHFLVPGDAESVGAFLRHLTLGAAVGKSTASIFGRWASASKAQGRR
jgi:hypothetical protein